ncbi:hypothetical protein LY76DRAFT_411998 [Colletotrichum caudatum]|nr:hypothetical protein LY76DRAFT_411998 [Colletotrichum caudatum]
MGRCCLGNICRLSARQTLWVGGQSFFLAKIKACMGSFVVPRRGNTPSARGQIFSWNAANCMPSTPHTSGTMSSDLREAFIFELEDGPRPWDTARRPLVAGLRRLPPSLSFTRLVLCHFGGTSIEPSQQMAILAGVSGAFELTTLGRVLYTGQTTPSVHARILCLWVEWLTPEGRRLLLLLEKVLRSVLGRSLPQAF